MKRKVQGVALGFLFCAERGEILTILSPGATIMVEKWNKGCPLQAAERSFELKPFALRGRNLIRIIPT